jgi:hypothetical protein
VTTADGDRPGGAPPSPSSPDDRPPKRLTYSDLSAAPRLRIVEVWRGPFQEALAEHLAERAEALTRAA